MTIYLRQIGRADEKIVRDANVLVGHKGEYLFSALVEAESWDEYFTKVYNEANDIDLPDGYMPSEVWLAFNSDYGELVGRLDIRLKLSLHLYSVNGGHIGYSVHPEHRQKGYATQMLAEAIKVCHKKGIDPIMVATSDENTASRKVVEKNGGKYVDHGLQEDQGSLMRRYWVTTPQTNHMLGYLGADNYGAYKKLFK